MTDKEANERLLKVMLGLAPTHERAFHEALVFLHKLLELLREADTPERPDSEAN